MVEGVCGAGLGGDGRGAPRPDGTGGAGLPDKGSVLAGERHVTLPRVKGVCLCLWRGQICDSKGGVLRTPGHADHVPHGPSIAPNGETGRKGEANSEGMQTRPTPRVTPSAVA